LRGRYQLPQIDVIDLESSHAKRTHRPQIRTPSTVAFGERVRRTSTTGSSKRGTQ